MAGIRLNWRRVLLVAVSGLALVAIFALISYFAPVTGKSHLGAFAVTCCTVTRVPSWPAPRTMIVCPRRRK